MFLYPKIAISKKYNNTKFMKKIAIYSGTFDPITIGHENITNRAADLFDCLIFAIAENSSKKPLFSLQERVNLAQQVLQNNPKIIIKPFSGFIADFMQENNVSVIVRGVRSHADFDYEMQMAGLQRQINPHIDTIFLLPDLQMSYISSSIVKDIAKHNGNYQNLVNPLVATALKNKFFPREI